MQPSISKSSPAYGQRDKPLCDKRVLVLICRDIPFAVLAKTDQPARSALAYLILILYQAGNLALGGRL
jgi:hypothetical protein